MAKKETAPKRLIKYLSDPKKYWVNHVRFGCLQYYDIYEAGKGVIDVIQKRTFDKCLEKGLITVDQFNKSNGI